MSEKTINTEKVVNTENLEEVKQAGTVIKLSRPVVWEDAEIKELRIDIATLSGDDIMDIESDFMDFVRGQRNVYVAFKVDHPGYLAVLAAKGAGVHPNLMKKLSARDFLKATGAAKDFLNGLV
ncbi:hypothetical protein SAMN05661091_4141 [Paenibacillus uliginis N3/975]|uniref:Phage tail assembly chaperone protein, E, or 41 or 14 n=1 Tax=Paenibacillus uliginis N3/975 TaxID=1313296 RepID=A0A1X7HM27_9BACL|nr:hypothetical protein [Paenibacillus uliginis]SMF88149.1 hypothetical protein SAMN05661091_4141 [Paenibacillus uliginis N3/975]